VYCGFGWIKISARREADALKSRWIVPLKGSDGRKLGAGIVSVLHSIWYGGCVGCGPRVQYKLGDSGPASWMVCCSLANVFRSSASEQRCGEKSLRSPQVPLDVGG
jgi:hypothetical protein